VLPIATASLKIDWPLLNELSPRAVSSISSSDLPSPFAAASAAASALILTASGAASQVSYFDERRRLGGRELLARGGKSHARGACCKPFGSCWIGFAQNWLGAKDGRAALTTSKILLAVAA
jgi:hypothetical protein